MEIFRKFSLKAKLMGLLILSVAGFVGMATYAYTSLDGLVGTMSFLGRERIQVTETVGDLKAASQGVARFLWLALANGPQSEDRSKSLTKAIENLDILKVQSERLGTFNLTGDNANRAKEVKGIVPKLVEVIERAKNQIAQSATKEADHIAQTILLKEMPPHAVKLTAILGDLSEAAKKRNSELVDSAEKDAKTAEVRFMIFAAAAGAIVFFVGLFLSVQVSASLLQITQSVNEASCQVSEASTQVARASQELSSASQEQASSLEETSASLTEIAGMVESNSKGAEAANESAREVNKISEDTRRSMDELGVAMSSILESNAKIERLVKVIEEIAEKTEVIDEIVFKTQLLSFNASVEAERAGEHGRGFAVVAQEVGNLAQMSGKAASEIASIVKASIKEAEAVADENRVKVESGAKLAASTGQKMAHVQEKLGFILEGTSKIEAASKEQTNGVSQIATSVDNLNQVTQSTAATAQESASAGEELSKQASSLLSLVSQLRGIVLGEQSRQNNLGSQAHVGQQAAGTVLPMRSKNPAGPRFTQQPHKKVVGLDNSTGKESLANNGQSGNDSEWERL